MLNNNKIPTAQLKTRQLTGLPTELEAKLVCKDVWKLFGKGAKKFQVAGSTLESITGAGLMPAVRAASLEIYQGEIFVIMGLSGSGKSTLLRCMSRLIEPTQGQVFYEGEDLLQKSERQMIELRRHRMGMVFQHFALLPHLSVLENVAFPLDIQGQSKPAREQRAREVIELVGLAGREDNLPHELSGGQQQRVGIARSLAVEPELWFLDEPFSALDPLIRREMQDEFLRLQGKLQKSIVFITHDFDEAIRLADRIAIMKDGEIIQIDTPEQLVLAPADDYVQAFTQHIAKEKVISVGRIMLPASATSVHPTTPVQVTDRVADIATLVYAAGQAVAVTDQQGVVCGSIDRHAIVELIVTGAVP